MKKGKSILKLKNKLMQTPVSKAAFTAARNEGKTVKELAHEFGISEANCKKIIAQLGLPKRGVKPGFVLVDDNNGDNLNQTSL
jgi:hypothetical protein